MANAKSSLALRLARGGGGRVYVREHSPSGAGISRYVGFAENEVTEVIVAANPRFLGETFCSMAAEILSKLSDHAAGDRDPAPTPAISYSVTQAKADGAINFTASHNLRSNTGSNFQRPMGPGASGSDEIHRSGDCCTR